MYLQKNLKEIVAKSFSCFRLEHSLLLQQKPVAMTHKQMTEKYVLIEQVFHRMFWVGRDIKII